jgi:hypothetical protein
MNKLRGLFGGGVVGGELGTVSGVTNIQGGVSTANLHQALSQKGLSTANLAVALATVPTAAPAPTQPAQGSPTPKADGGS